MKLKKKKIRKTDVKVIICGRKKKETYIKPSDYGSYILQHRKRGRKK